MTLVFLPEPNPNHKTAKKELICTKNNTFIILNIKSGFYFEIEGTSAFVWRCISENFDSQEIIEKAQSKYKDNGNIKDDIKAFIDDLLEEELIEEFN